MEIVHETSVCRYAEQIKISCYRGMNVGLNLQGITIFTLDVITFEHIAFLSSL